MGTSRDPDTDSRPPSSFEDNILLLDTNALMSPFQFGFNLDSELERAVPELRPVVPASVARELIHLVKHGDWKARAALRLASKYDWVSVRGRGDAPIFNLALNRGWAVMTQDRLLRKNLITRGIKVLVVRGGGHLTLLEP